MGLKFTCDICDKDITNDQESFKIDIIPINKDRYTYYRPYQYLCHDCYWKIQGFIKSIRNTEVEL